jgi:hypothetical protein
LRFNVTYCLKENINIEISKFQRMWGKTLKMQTKNEKYTTKISRGSGIAHFDLCNWKREKSQPDKGK